MRPVFDLMGKKMVAETIAENLSSAMSENIEDINKPMMIGYVVEIKVKNTPIKRRFAVLFMFTIGELDPNEVLSVAGEIDDDDKKFVEEHGVEALFNHWTRIDNN